MEAIPHAGRGAFLADLDLRRQMRRAASSTMSNIPEGFDAGTDSEFRRFLRMARRSMSEFQSHLYVALDQAYLAQKDFQDLYDRAAEIKRVIYGFVKYLTRSPRP